MCLMIKNINKNFGGKRKTRKNKKQGTTGV